MILINVGFKIKLEHRDAFIEVMSSMVTASCAEAGSIEYQFSANASEPTEFYLLELWQDEAALLAHFKTASFSEFMKVLPALGKMSTATSYEGDLSPYKIPI